MPRTPFPIKDYPNGFRGEITVEATFRGPLAGKLMKAARARNQHPNEMLALLVEKAVEDDLIACIIDDDDEAAA